MTCEHSREFHLMEDVCSRCGADPLAEPHYCGPCSATRLRSSVFVIDDHPGGADLFEHPDLGLVSCDCPCHPANTDPSTLEVTT